MFKMKSFIIFIFLINAVQSIDEYKNCLETSNGVEYKGDHSKIANGTFCDAWSKTHKFTIKQLKLIDYDYHYCRNPDNSTAPWCFVNGQKRFCLIPSCKSHPKTKRCILPFPPLNQSNAAICPYSMQTQVILKLKTKLTTKYPSEFHSLKFCCTKNLASEQNMKLPGCWIYLLPTSLDAANYSVCPPDNKQVVISDTQKFSNKHVVMCCKEGRSINQSRNGTMKLAYYAERNVSCGNKHKIEYSWPQKYSLFDFMKYPTCFYESISYEKPAKVQENSEIIITSQDTCALLRPKFNLTVFEKFPEFDSICQNFLLKDKYLGSNAEINGDICYYTMSTCKSDYKSYSIYDWGMKRYVHKFCCEHQAKVMVNLTLSLTTKFILVSRNGKCPSVKNFGKKFHLTVEHSIASLTNTTNHIVDICIFKTKEAESSKLGLFQWFPSNKCPSNYRSLNELNINSEFVMKVRDYLMFVSILIRKITSRNISTCFIKEKYNQLLTLNSTNLNRTLDNLVCFNGQSPGKCDLSSIASIPSVNCCVSYLRIVEIIDGPQSFGLSMYQLNKALIKHYGTPETDSKPFWVKFFAVIGVLLIVFAFILVLIKYGSLHCFPTNDLRPKWFNNQSVFCDETPMSTVYYKIDPNIDMYNSERSILPSLPEDGTTYEELTESVVYQDTNDN